MANWCRNTVTFSGSNVLEALEWIAEQVKEHEGVQFVEDKNESCIFDVYVDIENAYIQFETKWGPSIEQIQFVADKFNLSFEYEYYEPGCKVAGKYWYGSDWNLTHISLDKADFDQITYDDESGDVTFRGELWESEEEIIELLIEEKRAISKQLTTK